MTPQDFPRPRTIQEAAWIDALCGEEGASLPLILPLAAASTEGMRDGYRRFYPQARGMVIEDMARFQVDYPPGAQPVLSHLCLLCPGGHRKAEHQGRSRAPVGSSTLRESRVYRWRDAYGYHYGFAVDVYPRRTREPAPPAAGWLGSVCGFRGVPSSAYTCIVQLTVQEGYSRADLERHIPRLFGQPIAGNALDLRRLRESAGAARDEGQ